VAALQPSTRAFVPTLASCALCPGGDAEADRHARPLLSPGPGAMAGRELAAPLIATASAADPFYTIRESVEQEGVVRSAHSLRLPSTAASSRVILRCSVLDGEIRGLRVKFEEWQGLLSSCNTATDVGFRVKHEGALLCPLRPAAA
jgi:hypothetical protein